MYYYEVKNFLKNGYSGPYLMSRGLLSIITEPSVINRFWTESMNGIIVVNDFSGPIANYASKMLTNKEDLDEFIWIKLSSILING